MRRTFNFFLDFDRNLHTLHALHANAHAEKFSFFETYMYFLTTKIIKDLTLICKCSLQDMCDYVTKAKEILRFTVCCIYLRGKCKFTTNFIFSVCTLIFSKYPSFE